MIYGRTIDNTTSIYPIERNYSTAQKPTLGIGKGLYVENDENATNCSGNMQASRPLQALASYLRPGLKVGHYCIGLVQLDSPLFWALVRYLDPENCVHYFQEFSPIETILVVQLSRMFQYMFHNCAKNALKSYLFIGE